MKKLYAERDAETLGQFYADHVCAMTAEGLHDKSAIAAELAWRDKKISDLRDNLYYAKGRLEAYIETVGEERTGLGILVAMDFLKIVAAHKPASTLWRVGRDTEVEAPHTDTTYWVNNNYPQTEIEKLLGGKNDGLLEVRVVRIGPRE